MISKDLTIVNKLGLHARAATKLCNLAGRFASEIQLIKGDDTVNAKSIMGLMMLAASKGTPIKIVVEGDDEEKAMQAVADLINNRFEEAE